jgi:hypothetical protein
MNDYVALLLGVVCAGVVGVDGVGGCAIGRREIGGGGTWLVTIARGAYFSSAECLD